MSTPSAKRSMDVDPLPVLTSPSSSLPSLSLIYSAMSQLPPTGDSKKSDSHNHNVAAQVAAAAAQAAADILAASSLDEPSLLALSEAKKWTPRRHDDDRNRNHECLYCEARFLQADHLAVHTRTHTGEKPFSCTEPGCSAKFSQIASLQAHERVHRGIRPFACTHEGCDKRFTTAGQRGRHIRTHLGIKLHKCEYCESTFGESGSLKRHRQRHLGSLTGTDEKSGADSKPKSARAKKAADENGRSAKRTKLSIEEPSAESVVDEEHKTQ